MGDSEFSVYTDFIPAVQLSIKKNDTRQMQDECCQGQRLLYLIYAKQFSCSVSEGNAQLFSV